MSQNVTANQHYVPQTYLEAFSQDKHRCYVFDKLKKVLGLKHALEILWLSDIYTISPQDVIEIVSDVRRTIDFEPQSVEKILGNTIDGFWNNIVKNIDSNFEWFSLKYSYHFLDTYRCVAAQLIRTPTGKQHLKTIYSDVYNSDFSKIENVIFAKELLDILNKNADSNLLSVLLNEVGHICIGINDTNIPLITSDTPVFAIPNIWSNDKQTMLYYPITPVRCLFFMKRQPVSSQLSTVYDDINNGTFIISHWGDILQETYRREKKVTEKLNPLSKKLDVKVIRILNKCCYDKADRFIVSDENMCRTMPW